MSSHANRRENNTTNINRVNYGETDITHDFITQQINSSSGMTPSIITTINNTSPSPLANDSQHSDASLTYKYRTKPNDACYESFIEDSFVGHWEREDDDPDNPYNQGLQINHQIHHDTHGRPEEDSELHPSTIEFDFDSFGPESFIYTPPPTSILDTGRSDQQTPVPVVSQVPVSGGDTDQASDGELSSRNEYASRSPSPLPVNKPVDHKNSVGTGATPTINHTKHVSPASSPTPAGRPLVATIDNLVDIPQIDYKVIEPYKRVISHAGYCHQIDPTASSSNSDGPAPAVIVFSACYLPDRSRRDYDYVMDHLFLYVLLSLHELIADDYILIYLHNTQPSTISSSISSRFSASMNNIAGLSTANATSDHGQSPQNNLPKFSWMKRCYQMIDRRLRKNLRVLYLVKPTLWLKTIVIMCRPFISSKFSRKLHFIEDMNGLKRCLPVQKLTLPASADYI